ncbi:HIT domain-containing protein [Pistricoccus aurantiacus]|uniref:HIT domain-containing protein n=1 Tax=Pistricoccus aurantiacus TaxID=1883414 RepID=A0A5B8SSC5_9GAMM|nr:HIT family protein [Pistricoccus aurantiacus]QEA38907.1 HIT domain-containing protein [Pistricoccus aurantiacus]
MNDLPLDPRLVEDTLPVIDLPLSQVRLMNDRRFPWLVLVPLRRDISEVFELSREDQTQLWREATLLGQAMKDTLEGDKLNLATLGNQVTQLHLHVVIRKRDDDAWPGPVWGHGEAVAYTLEEQADMRARILAQIDAIDFSG